MKRKINFSMFLLALTMQVVLAQTQSMLSSQVLGVWKMTSQKGTDPNGANLSSDMAKFQQYKIITPTHWMYIYYDADSTKGSGDYGTYTLTGNKYVEALTGGYKTDFTLKVEGNKLYQDGAVILPDGKKVILHEVYEKVQEPANLNNDLVGVWEMTSTKDLKDGKEVEVTDLQETIILTPSHYMWVHKKKDGEFESAMVGTYKKEGQKVIPTPIIASFPLGDEKVEMLVDVKGDQMIAKGTMTQNGEITSQWTSINQKVGKSKVMKATSVK